MSNFTQIKQQFRSHRKWLGLIPVFLASSILPNYAQESLITPNQKTEWKEPTFNGFVVNTTASGYTGSIPFASNDTTKWITNGRNLIDSDLNNFASVRLVTDGSASANNRVNASSEITITNDQTYLPNNLIQLTYEISSLAGSAGSDESDFKVSIETSLDGITYTPILHQQKNALSSSSFIIGGYPSVSFKYIKVISKTDAYTVAGYRRGTVHLKGISFTKYQDALICNTARPMISSGNSLPYQNVQIVDERSGLIRGLPIQIGAVTTNLDRVTDTNLTNYGSMATGVGINLGSTFGVSSRDNKKVYPASSFLGYRISTVNVLNVSLLSGFQVVTYLNGAEQERYNVGASGLGVGVVAVNTPFNVGIITTKPADEVQLLYTPGIIDIGGVNIYYPVFKDYCEPANIACNEMIIMNNTDYPLEISSRIIAAIDIGVGTGVDSLQNILNGYDTSYAKIVTSVGLSVAATTEIIVEKALTKYSGTNYVGFEFDAISIADAAVLGNFGIQLFRNDTLVQTFSGQSLVSAGVPLLNGSGRKKLGAFTKLTFDEVRLTYKNPVSLQVADVKRIYNFFVEKFCDSPNAINPNNMTCNDIMPFSKPELPLYIDYDNTGFKNGINVAGDINNPSNAIDNDPNSAASIVLAANVLGSGSEFCVGDALNIYPANTYVAYDVEFNTLLDADVLGNIKIELLLDNNVVQTQRGYESLVGLNTGVLTGVSRRQKLGIVSNTDFNKVKITFGTVIIGASVGTINIYGLEISKMCAVTLACNQTYMLEQGSAPVMIDYSKTGQTGLVVVGNGVVDAENVIDTNRTNYAEIITVANVAGGNAIAVKNPVQIYPTGTFAGFTISNGTSGLLDLDLLNVINIKTYRNDTLQETSNGANLLNLDLLVRLIGPSHNAKNVGFITTKPFDEVVITVGQLVGLATDIRVYGAFIDTRTSMSGGLICNFNTQPDFAVTYINKIATGSVATNDNVPNSTKYNNLVANPNNPAPNALTLDNSNNGKFSFITSVPGDYNYTITACYSDTTTGGTTTICNQEILKITVLDDNQVAINNPVVNHDAGKITKSLLGLSSILVNVLANDYIGNEGGTLDYNTLTIIEHPTNGTVSITPEGKISYRPNANFTGIDNFWYRICETPSNTCDSAMVQILVEENIDYSIVANDDYLAVAPNTTSNVGASQGLLVNDISLGGDPISVIPFQDTIANVGTITVNANGSYKFIPATGYTGTAIFVYEATNGYNTAFGTLHLLVGNIVQPLDITLVSFSATETKCNQVMVQWTTSKEVNLSHYNIEYSTNGSLFQTIATIEGKNSINGYAYQYEATHKDAIGYYRLHAIDFDGTSSYSNVAKVASTCNQTTIQFQPNPTTGVVQVNGTTPNSTIQVWSINGQMLQSITTNSTQTNIDLSAYAAGTYLIKVIDFKGTTTTSKIVKK